MIFNLMITGDGSHSLYSDELHEGYHSKYGAVNESIHVFIRSGFGAFANANELNILEVGFGTGLNALLTQEAATRNRILTQYDAIEPFPLDKEIYTQLNYPKFIADEDSVLLFLSLHEAKWNNTTAINDFFKLKKYNCRFEEFATGGKLFDLVYFDAFSPDVQPELWTPEVFRKSYKLMKQGGILVTYSAKGYVRRNLQVSGFRVERIPGPIGKREMIRAVKVPC